MSGTKANNAPSDKQLTQMGGPWLPLQDPYKKAIANTQRINKQPWEYGPGVIEGFNPTQQAGIQGGSNLATSGLDPFTGALNFSNVIAGGGQFNKTPGTAAVADVAQGGIQGPAYDRLVDIMNQSGQGSGGVDYAQRVMRGEFLDEDNPYLDQMVKDINTDTTNSLLPQLEGRMAMSGRLGSGVEGVGQGEIARRLAQNATGLRYGDYATERGYQQQAGMSLPTLQATELGSQANLANQVNQDAYQRLQMQMNAAQQANNMENADINTALGAGNNVGANYANMYMPYDRAMQYGGMEQAQQERMNQEAQDRFRYNQAAPYEKLNRTLSSYNQIAGTTNPAMANQAYAESLQRPSAFQQGVGNITGLLGAGAQIAAPFFPAAAPAMAGGFNLASNMMYGGGGGSPYMPYGGPR